MLPLPSPPTDNIYKFLSISGILLLGVGLVLPTVIEQDQNDFVFRLVKEHREKGADILFKYADLMNKDKFISTKEERKKEMEGLHQNLEVTNKAETKMFEVEFEKRIANDKSRLDNLWWVRFFGVALAAAGFALWYFQVQRHQDRILKLELAKAEKELEAVGNKLQ